MTLRAATEEDAAAAAEAAKELTVDQAAATGDPLKLAIAMRTRIAQAIADPRCAPRDLAALTKRLADIAKEIVALEAGRNGDDEVGSAAGTEDAPFDASAV